MRISKKLVMALSLAALPFFAQPVFGQDKLDKDKGAGTVRDQERAYLSESYHKAGRTLFDEMRYREAAAQLRLAVRADPNNAEARKLLDQTLYILGEKDAGYRDEARQFIREREVKTQQASMEVERIYAEGQRAMNAQEYDTAKDKFERTLEMLRWFPYQIDKSGLKNQVEASLADAKKKQAEQEAANREYFQKLSKEEAAIAEQRQLQYQQARVRQLFEQAVAAFDRTEYAKCETLCKSLLKQEPGNEKAMKLLERASASRRFKEELYTIENGIEEMKRLIEGVYSAAVPYQQIFQFPEDEKWEAVQKRAIDLQLAFERKGAPESPDEQRIKQVLASRKVTINFPGTSFDDAINFLRDITGLNYYVAQPVTEALASEPVTINLKLRDITLKNALELILQQAKNLIYKVKLDAVYINTKDAEKEDLFLRFYEVGDIVNNMPDNPAPKLALADTNKRGGGGGSAGGILTTGADDQPKGSGIEADKLKELVDQKISEEGGSVEFMGGLLMVRKSLEAHRKVEKLLESLRRTTGVMVTVETRIIDIQDNFLEEVGVDFRGLPSVIANAFGSGGRASTGYNYTSSSGLFDLRARSFNAFTQLLGSAASTPFNLTNVGGAAFQYNVLEDFQLQMIIDAVKKKQKAKQVDAPRVTVFNSQRSHVMAVGQRAYISDVEVNQTGVTPTINPVISVLNTGSILEARPLVSHDRKFVTLEIQPTIASLLALVPQQVQLSSGNTSITIELPVVSLAEVRSTVMVPDGGTVILGGLKNFLEQDKKAGIPILSGVPIIHTLFERRGWADLKRSLVFLLKVDITIVREEEAKRFNKQAPLPTQVQ